MAHYLRSWHSRPAPQIKIVTRYPGEALIPSGQKCLSDVARTMAGPAVEPGKRP